MDVQAAWTEAEDSIVKNQLSEDVDINQDVVSTQALSKRRVDHALPICCPRHRKTQALVNDTAKFPTSSDWNKFCHEICNHPLPECNHRCLIPCHSPTLIPHTKQCVAIIPRPCPYHPHIPLLCHVARDKYKTLELGLSKFNCEVMVDYRRPECEHSVRLQCWEYQSLLDGSKELFDCQEIVDDYVFACGHVISNPTCTNRREFEINPPPCSEQVVHIRADCRCKVPMTCHKSTKEALHPTLCKASRGIERPRCFHKISLRCFEGAELAQWWRNNHNISAEKVGMISTGTASTIVRHGVEYGPSEKRFLRNIKECEVRVKYVNACGHEVDNVPCSRAFALATNLTPAVDCTKNVVIQSPLCRHNVTVPCCAAMTLRAWDPWGENGIPRIDHTCGNISIHEHLTRGGLPFLEPSIMNILQDCCKQQVNIRRSCDPSHILSLSCGSFINYMSGKVPLPKCDVMINRSLSCDHSIRVKCYTRYDPPPACCEQVDDEYQYSCGVHRFRPGTCSRYQSYVESTPPCPEIVQCRRYRCHHLATVQCYHRNALESISPGARSAAPSQWISEDTSPPMVDADTQYCSEISGVEECKELVSYRQVCGHVLSNVHCGRAFHMASGKCPTPSCGTMVMILSPLCGHEISIPCSLTPLIAQYNPWNDEGLPVLEVVVDDVSSSAEGSFCRVIRTSSKKPSKPIADLLPYLKCNGHVQYVRECEHAIRISCVSAYFDKHQKCLESTSHQCQDCGFETIMQCQNVTNRIKQGLKITCSHKLMKLCSICKINETMTLCSEKQVSCNQKVTSALLCGHQVSWHCGHDNNPLLGTDQCRGCVIPLWENAISFAPQDEIIPVFQQRIHQLLQDKILSHCTIKKSDIIDIQKNSLFYKNHISARQEIMLATLNLLQSDGDVPVCKPPPLWDRDEDILNYHILCCNVSLKDPTDLNELYASKVSLKDTPVGRGSRLKNINTSSDLEQLNATNDGSQYLLFCAAYCNRPLLGAKEFVAGSGNSEVQQARKISKEYMKRGYDCCQIPSSQDYLYWIPGAVIPIMTVHLTAQVECKICMEYHPPSKGIFCCNHHFICWDDLQEYINHAGGVDVVGNYTDSDGNLLCSDCSKPYELDKLASNKNVFDLLLNLKTTLRERIAANEATKAENERMRKEYERIQQLTGEEREIEFARNNIIENILTLRCPRCKAAFADFDGCFALTCGVAACHTGFCAWCLTDCGTSAETHAHLRVCPENRTHSYYGSQEDFQAHHKRCRHRRTLQKIASLNWPSHKQRTLKDRMRKEFSDLGIDIDSNVVDERL